MEPLTIPRILEKPFFFLLMCVRDLRFSEMSQDSIHIPYFFFLIKIVKSRTLKVIWFVLQGNKHIGFYVGAYKKGFRSILKHFHVLCLNCNLMWNWNTCSRGPHMRAFHLFTKLFASLVTINDFIKTSILKGSSGCHGETSEVLWCRILQRRSSFLRIIPNRTFFF